MEMDNCETITQEGPDGTAVGESLRASARSPQSYSGGDVNCHGSTSSIVSSREINISNRTGESGSRQSLLDIMLSDSDTSQHSASIQARKRPNSSGSESLPRKKINSAHRGRGGRKGSQFRTEHAPKDLDNSDKETYRLNPDDVAQPEKKKSGKKAYSHLCGDDFSAEDLLKRALDEVEVIQEQSRKSKNMNGQVKGVINQSLVTMRDVIESLKTRTTDEETRRLKADNQRLSRELANLRSDLCALRQDYEERNMRAKNAPPSVPPPTPLTSPEVNVEDIIRRVTISVGDMVNARIAGLEDRLLPEKTLRPPLAADARKKSSTAALHSAGSKLKSATPIVKSNAVAHQIAGPSANEVFPSSQGVTNAVDGEGWATVTKRGRKKKVVVSAISSAVDPQLKKATTASHKKRKKIALPRSAAVVITLTQEAVEKGITYTEVLTKAKNAINLTELGIDGIRSKVTATGARMLELPGTGSSAKADLLAERLQSTLNEVARIGRPVNCVELRINGLDDSINKEDVVAAIASQGGCPSDNIKVGDIRAGPGATGVVYVRCPATAAKVVAEKGRLLVGWSSARVSTLKSRPMRCYRCMGIGHTRQLCPSEKDRGTLCFRCGKEGHMAAHCKTLEPHCAVCFDLQRPASHRMGSAQCNPPAVRGKSTLTPRFAPAAEALEGVVMSD